MKKPRQTVHLPVLVEEVMDGLSVRPGGVYVDGTVGGGGHARYILERSEPGGRLIGIDLDPEALVRAGENLTPHGERFLLHEGSYSDIREIIRNYGLDEVDGILIDLGSSLEQLTSGDRGFSFRESGPLDMRFGPHSPTTAEQIVNHYSERRLKELFQTYGEERFSGRIARAIVNKRPLRSTTELVDVVCKAVPGGYKRIHPATRVFQALRIAVNNELTNVENGIKAAAGCLAEGGRLCVISYHSLEDRLAKGLFRMLAQDVEAGPFHIVTKKPLRPTENEIRRNPSARSAKLRVLQRIEE